MMGPLTKTLVFAVPIVFAVLLSFVAWDEYKQHQFRSGLFSNAAGTVVPAIINRDLAVSAKQRRLQEIINAEHYKGRGVQSMIFLTFLDSPAARKQRDDLQRGALGGDWALVANTTQQQYEFLLQSNSCVNGAAERFQLLNKSNHSHLAEELWKYCALWQFGGMYLDADSHLLSPLALKGIINDENNGLVRDGMAVLMDAFAPNSIHGSLLLVRQAKSNVALEMAKHIVGADISLLMESPLLLPHKLHELIFSKENTNDGWYLLQQSCSENPFRPTAKEELPTNFVEQDHYNIYTCARSSGLCCFVYSNNEEGRVALMGSRKPIQPTQTVSLNDLPKPIHSLSTLKSELPFISTIRIKEPGNLDQTTTDNQQKTYKTFFEQLQERDCLPSHTCNKCLADKKHGATCQTCLESCPCYCRALCKEDEKETPIAALRFHEILVTKPRYSRDPTRLIPRMIHQTWFEKLDPKKYPNMSRLTESFKTSGWTYNFYTDEKAEEFLSEHFPPQVRQAYDLLLPGAFKADLFRYCCLLIHGGAYADVDTMMGPSLDAAIPPDVGFMVGLDEPGKRIGKRHCVWNGFLAAMPGHPFLAEVIESVVNNIHQRFTSVDMAREHCPSPEMSIITSFSPLFVAGPCMLGSTINKVLGNHGQSPFEAGTLPTSDSSVKIPGRTIILNQNKMDMGAHRFTSLEQNLIVLSTDFPDSDDREKLDDYEHYSETRVRFETYGTDGVYVDTKRNITALVRLTVE